MSDNVGVNMLRKMEANREAPRAGSLRVVIGDGWNSCEIREAHRHRSGTPMEMRRARQRGSFRRRRKPACQQDALRMRRSEPGMDTTVNFVKSFDDFMAEGQQFFVRGQGHGWFSVRRSHPSLLYRQNPTPDRKAAAERRT